MLVDGVPWSATSGVTAIRTSGILSIAGTDPIWNLSFAVAANAPGAYFANMLFSIVASSQLFGGPDKSFFTAARFHSMPPFLGFWCS